MARIQNKSKEFSTEEVSVPEAGYDAFDNIPMLENLSLQQKRSLRSVVEKVTIAENDYMFKENEEGDALYIILSGALKIIKQIGGKDVTLDVVGSGDMVGEMAILTGNPRMASGLATTKIEAAKISREGLNELGSAANAVIEEMWNTFADHQFDTFLLQTERYANLTHKQKLQWLSTGTKQVVFANSFIKPGDKATHLFIYHGAYRIGSEAAFGPRMVELPIKEEISTTGECRTVELNMADLKSDDED